MCGATRTLVDVDSRLRTHEEMVYIRGARLSSCREARVIMALLLCVRMYNREIPCVYVILLLSRGF